MGLPVPIIYRQNNQSDSIFPLPVCAHVQRQLCREVTGFSLLMSPIKWSSMSPFRVYESRSLSLDGEGTPVSLKVLIWELLKHPCFRTLEHWGAAVCYLVTISLGWDLVTPVTLSVQDSGRALVHKEAQTPGAHTVEAIGPKAHASLSIICWCQHEELCGRVDARCSGLTLGKANNSCLWEFFAFFDLLFSSLTLFCPSLHSWWFQALVPVNSTLAVLANLKGKWHKTFYNDGKDLCILFPMWQPQPYVIVECLKGGQ